MVVRRGSSGAGRQALVVSGRRAPRSTGSSAIRAAAIRRSSAAACLRLCPLTVCRRCSHRYAGGGLSRSSAAACLRPRPLTGATAMQAAEPLLGRRLPASPSPHWSHRYAGGGAAPRPPPACGSVPSALTRFTRPAVDGFESPTRTRSKRTGKTRTHGVMTRNTRTLTRNLAAEDTRDTGADTGDTFRV
jgi:hypothetical protein